MILLKACLIVLQMSQMAQLIQEIISSSAATYIVSGLIYDCLLDRIRTPS